jgi:hypothetical protein
MASLTFFCFFLFAGVFLLSHFSYLSHGPLLASALLAGSPLGRLWGDTLGACELSLVI